MAIDPLAEQYFSLSPYNYVANTPINAIDPDGSRIEFLFTERGDGNYNLTINVYGKVLDLTKSGDINTDQIAEDLNESGSKVYDGGFRVTEYNSETKEYDRSSVSVNVDYHYESASSIDDLRSDDHVVAIVDEIPEIDAEKTQSGLAIDPYGLAQKRGAISLVEKDHAYSNKVPLHETAHNLGYEDAPTIGATNLMGVGINPNGYILKETQHRYALNNIRRQGMRKIGTKQVTPGFIMYNSTNDVRKGLIIFLNESKSNYTKR